MEWFNTSEIPETGERIVVVCNAYYNNETHCMILSGTFKKHITEECPHCFRIGLTNNSDTDFIMNDIQAWAYEKDVTDEAIRTANEECLKVQCPHCGNKVSVFAEMHDTYWADMPIIKNTLTNHIRLGWEFVEAETDFKYVCGDCSKKLGETLEDISNLQKKEVRTFADDSDKVLDLLLLSKEEFLKSYSYITEEEYDNTVEVLKENIGKKGE